MIVLTAYEKYKFDTDNLSTKCNGERNLKGIKDLGGGSVGKGTGHTKLVTELIPRTQGERRREWLHKIVL